MATPYDDDDDDIGEAESIVRPWMVTRGRTRSDLPVEALVVATDKGQRSRDQLGSEYRAIVGICDAPMGVAEISARLKLPLGTARVLIQDLVDNELVSVPTANSGDPDIAFLERLIDGVKRS